MRDLKKLVLICLCAAVFAGCGENPDNRPDNQAEGAEVSATVKETVRETADENGTETVQEVTVDATMDATTEPVKLIDTGKYVGISHPSPVLDNRIYSLDGLDRTFFGTGNGPAADEYGRPYSALNKMNEFAKYQSYFVRDDVTDKVIFLTFDEGYEYGCTEAILDTLKEKDVKAVFFVTLPYVKTDPQLVSRMIDEGHIVGNHSVSHLSFPSLGVDTQIAEITELHQYMLDNFDYDMWLFRYPKGEYDERSLAIVNNLGYASVFWSFAYKDYDVNNQPDINEAYAKLVSKLHCGAIYLLHAESTTNTAILGDFIDAARNQGYRFERFETVQENSYRD